MPKENIIKYNIKGIGLIGLNQVLYNQIFILFFFSVWPHYI